MIQAVCCAMFEQPAGQRAVIGGERESEFCGHEREGKGR
jgi:hypothetical protein